MLDSNQQEVNRIYLRHIIVTEVKKKKKTIIKYERNSQP